MYPEMRHALEKRGLLKAKVAGHKEKLTWHVLGFSRLQQLTADEDIFLYASQMLFTCISW